MDIKKEFFRFIAKNLLEEKDRKKRTAAIISWKIGA